MVKVQNEHVSFESDEVSQHILMGENGKMHTEKMAEEMTKESPEMTKAQKKAYEKKQAQRKKWISQGKCGNCGKKKGTCECGRNCSIDANKLKLLYMAFCMNYTDAQACLYSGVSTSAFYDYQNKNPAFKEQKALLKNTTKMYAKANIFKSLVAGDVENAKWLLERLEKDTYSKKDMIEQQTTVTVRDPLRDRLLQLKERKKANQQTKKTGSVSQKKAKSGKPKATKRVFRVVKKAK